MKKFFTLIAAVAMAASVNAQSVTKTFTETTVFITNGANVEAAVEEGWAVAGITTTKKKGSVDPETGEDGGEKSYNAEGIMLKKGNTSKALTIKVKGVSSITAYGATASSTDARKLTISAVSDDGVSADGAATSEPNYSAVLTMGLFPEDTYTITFDGVDSDDLTKGADVALHGIKFVVAGDPTGITNVATAASAKSGKTYNIAGQEVSSSYKGLVIKNGKKYVK